MPRRDNGRCYIETFGSIDGGWKAVVRCRQGSRSDELGPYLSEADARAAAEEWCRANC